MAMKVLAKCMTSSKGRVGATGLSKSYRGLKGLPKIKSNGYATIVNADSEKVWSRKPNGSGVNASQGPAWHKMVDYAREALDNNSNISEDEKEAVLGDLQRRVESTSAPQTRKEMRLHFTLAIQQDDVPAALKTFTTTSRLTERGRTVDAIMEDVRTALDDLVHADDASKAALLSDLTDVLASARNLDSRRAISGKIFQALRHTDVLAALRAIAEQKENADLDDIGQGLKGKKPAPANAETLVGVDHITSNFPLPTQDDFPHRKIDKLFTPESCANTIDNMCKKRNIKKAAKMTFESRTAPGRQIWTCKLQLTIADVMTNEEFIGQGLNKQSAQHAAWLLVLSKLFTDGVLATWFSKKANSLAKKKQEPLAPAPAPAPETVAAPPEDLPFPTEEQYPNALTELWEPRTISSAIHNACQKQKLSLEVEGDARTGKLARYELRINIPGTLTETATGVAKTTKDAKTAAWVNMVARMHASGTLSQLFPGPAPATTTDSQKANESKFLDEDVELVTVDDRTMQAEKDSKIEIYNYAASYGFVPEFEVKHVLPRTRRSRVGPNKKAKPVVQASIKLKQLGIEVSSAGKDLSTAEVAVALEFKRQAEKIASAAEDDEDAPFPAFRVLNVENAPDFFNYYRSINRGMFLDLEHEQKEIAKTSHTMTSVMLNGTAVGAPVAMRTKKNSTAVAHLCAAVEILKNEPDLIYGFAEAIKQGKGKFLKPQRPVNVHIPMETLDMMKDTLVQARRDGLPDEHRDLTAEDTTTDYTRHSRRGIIVEPEQRAAASRQLLLSHQQFQQDPALEQLRATKAALPMSQYRSQVIEIAQNLYSIIIGATGSGKTTQVPQILLEDAIERGEGGSCDIICTQPRRLAATSVAQRVAAERNESLQKSVGYQVRFDAKLPKPAGSITYCTTGILLEQLKHDADAIMDRVSHLVIDEVHERDLNIDFLLIILKKAIKARQAAGKAVPKVILMSATLDTKLFAEYLTRDGSGQNAPCPSLSVPGRTFPVKERYLQDVLDELSSTNKREFDALLQAENPAVSLDYLDVELKFAAGVNGTASETSSGIDWKRENKIESEEETQASNEKEDGLIPVPLLAATIAQICNTSPDDGAILCFLPGLNEITRTEELLLRQSIFGVNFSDPTKFKIHPLHSQIGPQEQNAVLDRPAPGCRKIILSTNIAETSITVPDVKHVIDLGKLRENRYDQMRRITKLQTVWESNSNARQRAGRAGRVQEGNYYGLYTRERRSAMAAAGLPELLRSDLQTICLSIKAQGFEQSVASFLQEAIESPAQHAVDSAVENLKAISAFTSDEKLTSLGRVLSKLPVHPSLGKMILLGVVFRCLDPMLVLGAMDGERSLFMSPVAMRTQARKAHSRFNEHKSDQLALLEAFRELRRARVENGIWRASDFARENFLHMGAFKSIDGTAQQIEQILEEAGIIPQTYQKSLDEYGGRHLNVNSGNANLIKCLFLAGVHPNIGVKSQGKSQLHRTATEQGAMLHPGSLNVVKGGGPAAEEERLYAYSALAQSVDGKNLFIRDATVITPLMAMLFGGTLSTKNFKSVEMDEWLPFRFDSMRPEYTTRLVLEFRKALTRVLHSAFKSLSTRGERNLEDGRVREGFAANLAEILETLKERDGSGGREPWVPSGWGQGSRGGRS